MGWPLPVLQLRVAGVIDCHYMSYAEALIANVTAFGDRAFKKVIKVK